MFPKNPPRLHILCFAWALPQGDQPGSAGWEAGRLESGRQGGCQPLLFV